MSEISVGMRFGSLVISRQVNKRSWECLCDCGSTKTFYHKAIISEHRSCGCKGLGLLVNKTVNNWTAVKAVKNRRGVSCYECVCICGKVSVKTDKVFRSGRGQSCGCSTVKKTRKNKLPRDVIFFNRKHSDYKYNAKARGIDFSLSREFSRKLMESKCYYCGQICGASNGIDRKDNSIGYYDFNVVPCCSDCNKRKSVTHHDDFLGWIKAVHDNLNLGGKDG